MFLPAAQQFCVLTELQACLSPGPDVRGIVIVTCLMFLPVTLTASEGDASGA